MRERARRPTEPDILDELEDGLQIDENALDEALLEQPDLFYRVSKQYELALSRRDAAKQAVEEAEAESLLLVKDNARRNDDKITDPEAKAKASLLPKVREANTTLLERNRVLGQYRALKESFEQRSYALKELSGLYQAGYFGDLTPTGQQSGVRARQAMNEVRQARKR